MKVVSFFAGCGGLDLGFEQAGFHVVWANEFEPSVHATYEKNHPDTILCKDDITTIDPKIIPDCGLHRWPSLPIMECCWKAAGVG